MCGRATDRGMQRATLSTRLRRQSVLTLGPMLEPVWHRASHTHAQSCVALGARRQALSCFEADAVVQRYGEVRSGLPGDSIWTMEVVLSNVRHRLADQDTQHNTACAVRRTSVSPPYPGSRLRNAVLPNQLPGYRLQRLLQMQPHMWCWKRNTRSPHHHAKCIWWHAVSFFV